MMGKTHTKKQAVKSPKTKETKLFIKEKINLILMVKTQNENQRQQLDLKAKKILKNYSEGYKFPCVMS